MKAYLGGDPGRGGGFAVVTDEGHAEAWPMPLTEIDTLRLCREIADRYPGIRGSVEKVHAGGGQGVKSNFTFGANYKEMRMGLLAAGIGFDDIQPKAWQKQFSMHKGKDTPTVWKNRLKARAQQLYPDLRVTLKTADAILIAHAFMVRS